MTESGCQQCGDDTYSSDGANICTSCPDGKICDAGSISEADCYEPEGKKMIDLLNSPYMTYIETL